MYIVLNIIVSFSITGRLHEAIVAATVGAIVAPTDYYFDYCFV